MRHVILKTKRRNTIIKLTNGDIFRCKKRFLQIQWSYVIITKLIIYTDGSETNDRTDSAFVLENDVQSWKLSAGADDFTAFARSESPRILARRIDTNNRQFPPRNHENNSEINHTYISLV